MSDVETRIHEPVSDDNKGKLRGSAILGILAGIILIVSVTFLTIYLLGQSQPGESVTLNSANPSASHPDGITITYTDCEEMRLRLGSIPRELFMRGQADKSLDAALAAIPSYLDMKSPLYTLYPKDECQVSISIVIPNDAEPYHTLDLYEWDADAGEWRFLAGHVDLASGVIRTNELPQTIAVFQTRADTPLLATTLEEGHMLDAESALALNLVMPVGLYVQADGSLTGIPVEGWQFGAGYAVAPVVRPANDMALPSLLDSPAGQALFVEEMTAMAANGDYNGIVLDFGMLTPPYKDTFSALVADLSTAFNEIDKVLIVTVTAPSGEVGSWDTGGYDWRAIGESADLVVITTGPNPADYAVSGQWITMLSWAVGEISRYKIYVSSSVYSYDETHNALLSYEAALEPLGTVYVAPEVDDSDAYEVGDTLAFDLSGTVIEVLPDQNTGSYIYTVELEDGSQRVWILTANALRARLDMLSNLNIVGMALEDLGNTGNDPALAQMINEFRTQSVSSVSSQLKLQWTLSDASGAILSGSTGVGTPWIWNAPYSGNFTVKGELVGSNNYDRGSVGVEVAEVTDEPTPEPTTETPESTTETPTTAATTGTPEATTETPTPTPTAEVPTETAPPPVAIAGWGSGFAIGGQVPGYISHPGEMHSAGMTWVKQQQKWHEGLDPSVVAGMISEAHANGFKILLSIPGQLYPDSINYASYVEFLRGVASYGPDAIEIWNEMNLDREWPAGQISPTTYVNSMLAPAFNAIKSVSPGTQVIIGALAPTGFDNDINAWSDLRYVQGMSAAGAANYADCIGAHHNSGTTSPSVRSGRPEGDHYSWYYMPTIEVYYYGMGGALPVCVTEFGYLSPEGFSDPLPSTFAWAATNTLQNQVDWLAEGVQISRNTGFIPLVIIWNVDFTVWSQYDPTAGYAIIRPGGSCPACGSLGAVAP